jgi:hypothetical protein
MLLKSSSSMIALSFYCVVALCLALTACAGGYYASKINEEKDLYRVDEQGTKSLVYETDSKGQTTIHDAEDPKAKQQVAAQERSDQMRKESGATRSHPHRSQTATSGPNLCEAGSSGSG